MMHTIRGSDVFLKSDIKPLLEALILATQGAQPELTERSRGIIVGVALVAKGLGIELDCEVKP